MKIINILKNKWNYIIIIVFILLTCFVTNFHEPWSDEAQSYLLARDNTFIEIFKYIKYEGTPPLWVCILHIFIKLGLTYNLYCYIPIIFSIIGVSIFELKIDAPWYLKLLLPFTYFIAYQYSIIARSYCLIFPTLMILLCINKTKIDRPFLYALVLLILMSISLHTLVIAGSLYLIFIFDTIENNKIKNKKNILAILLIFFEFLCITIITFPSKDCNFAPSSNSNIFRIIAESTIGSLRELYIYDTIIVLTTISIITVLSFFRRSNNLRIFLDFFITFFPVTVVTLYISSQVWHIGIITLLMFYFILENKIFEYTLEKIFLIIICLIQVFWTFSSYKYDIQNNYSASKDVANFIIENNYEEKNINAIQFSTTAIEPYFNKNIFINHFPYDKAFWFWSQKNTQNNDVYPDADIYIFSEFYIRTTPISLLRKLEENDNYKKIEFSGNTYLKTHIYESEGYIIYVKNNIAENQ